MIRVFDVLVFASFIIGFIAVWFSSKFAATIMLILNAIYIIIRVILGFVNKDD